MYQIGLFSKLNQISIKTLRHYDDINLLKPAKVDPETGYRYYTLNQSYTVHRIQTLKNMGFGLEDIRHILAGSDAHALLLAQKADLLQEIAEKTSSLAQLEYYLAKSTQQQTPYDILVKELPEVYVASYQKVIPSYKELFQIMNAVNQKLTTLQCSRLIPEYCFTQYLDEEYRETDIAVKICEAVTEKQADSLELTFITIPKVTQAACLFHRGGYDTLPEAYSALMDWIEKNGYRPDGLARESYLDGIWNHTCEAAWLTEIQMPVVKV